MLRNRQARDRDSGSRSGRPIGPSMRGAVPPPRASTDRISTLMPQIRATAANIAAIRTEAGARGYRLIGLDIGVDPGITQLTNLVDLGPGSDTRVDAEPSDIVIDRSLSARQ